MYKFYSPLLLLIVFTCILNIDAVAKRDRNDYTKNPYRIVCYFGSWANYHKIDPFLIEDIDANLCTHVNYGFAKLNEYSYEIEAFDPWLDLKKETGNLRAYERFVNLRKINPQLTTIIALGGWYEGSEKYSDMARDPKLRKKFVESAVAFLVEHDFDGLDVDWEYPSNRGGSSKVDKDDFIALLTELKAAFEPHGFLLSSAVSPGKKTIDSAYDIPKLNELLDIINVMAYDYHGGWDDRLGHNAPLYKRPEETDEVSLIFNVNYTVNYWIEKGADKKKMVLGMPLYGRAWTLESPEKHKLNDTVKGMSPAGFISGEEGVLGYNEICEIKKNQSSDWTTVYDPYYKAPYAYNKTVWVGYDDVKSLSCKLAFLKKMGLSGGMVWAMENDDFKNRCGGGKNPLLNKVHNMLNGNEKESFECTLEPEPTSPTTVQTTRSQTVTTPPTTRPTTTQSPKTTQAVTTSPKTQSTKIPSPVTEVNTGTPHVTGIIDGHTIKCFKSGYISHPTNRYKYVVCEYIAGGPKQGWWIHVMECAPGTRWHQPIENCIEDDSF